MSKIDIMKIKDLINVMDKKFDLVHKSVGVELVELGFMNYKKLTPENYYYWWYEQANKKDLNRRIYTYSWHDLVPTSKFGLIKNLISFHHENESGFRLLTNALNISAAMNDGINLKTGRLCVDEVYEVYYPRKNKYSKQLQLF